MIYIGIDNGLTGRPLRGGRGLKRYIQRGGIKPTPSPPTRGARIETPYPRPIRHKRKVAPYAGGAD